MIPKYYPNCSELVADFAIHDPEEMCELLLRLGKKHGFHFEPMPTVEYLQGMIDDAEKDRGNGRIIKVMDSEARETTFEYGPNGYDENLGFRFDTGCNHYDKEQYPFLRIAEQLGARVESYDGGSTSEYEKWKDEEEV